ncbi:hypothetical protein SanaruYs_28280 [Chryseotalea sanaruensis]|uniref:Uncharacterized protein n=1 Tax=Chryseotalea sanaruensis TaxID=2482724 RepID=A0A401UCE6_9BACT|nr:hypothetical protein [Chryseotalea sanaruensis]GCC52591.1 hypothetical protein SanaruYs_28280 [Chryseotalea sanaruensis]
MGLFDFLKKNKDRMKDPEDYFQVTINDEGVIVEHPKREKEQVKWADIDNIKIITTDQGPFQPDVWLALLGKDSGCLIPQGAKGHEEVYNVVSKYDRFDFENVIKAMSSTDNQEFLVWTRECL